MRAGPLPLIAGSGNERKGAGAAGGPRPAGAGCAGQGVGPAHVRASAGDDV